MAALRAGGRLRGGHARGLRVPQQRQHDARQGVIDGNAVQKL
jgi:hypothetical protein